MEENKREENTPTENRHRTWWIVRYHYNEDGTRSEEVIYENYAITPSFSEVYDSAMKREKIIDVIVIISIISILLFGLAIMFIYLK